MTSNVAFDVFIGLVFVFLSYSLLASIIQETIASFLNLRASVLVKAIRIMLNDRKPLNLKNTSALGKIWERIALTFEMQWHHITCRLPDFSLAKAFYKHPSIKYLSPNSARSKPSYIEPQNFSATLLKILRGKNYDGSVPAMLCIYNTLYPMITSTQQNPNLVTVEVGKTDPVKAIIQPETLDQLRQFYIDSGKDVNTFTILLENWYNETMDRANGWYKRQVRRILFAIGLVIAICGNVDTIKIYHILSKDKAARDQMVQMAIQSQAKYGAAISELKDSVRQRNKIADSQKIVIITTGDSILNQAYQNVNDDIEQSNYVLAMGWHESKKYKRYDSLNEAKSVLKESLSNQKKADSALQKQLQIVTKQIDLLEPEVYDKFDWSSSPLGWLITALALTLGAPFWFDLLSKFISLRAAGTKPDAEPDKADKSVPEVIPKIPATVIAEPIHAIAVKERQPEFVPDEATDSNLAQG